MDFNDPHVTNVLLVVVLILIVIMIIVVFDLYRTVTRLLSFQMPSAKPNKSLTAYTSFLTEENFQKQSDILNTRQKKKKKTNGKRGRRIR